MSVCACCNTITDKWNELIEVKNTWIGKKVAWILGEREYSEITKVAINTLVYVFALSAILTVMIGSIYKGSLSDDAKILFAVSSGTVLSLAISVSLLNETIYRYQPNPPPSYIYFSNTHHHVDIQV